MMQASVERATWTIEETAKLLGVSRAAAYSAARRGEIPTLRFGKRWVVPRHALEELLRKRRMDARSERD